MCLCIAGTECHLDTPVASNRAVAKGQEVFTTIEGPLLGVYFFFDFFDPGIGFIGFDERFVGGNVRDRVVGRALRYRSRPFDAFAVEIVIVAIGTIC